jgi:hypothetical protein
MFLPFLLCFFNFLNLTFLFFLNIFKMWTTLKSFFFSKSDFK